MTSTPDPLWTRRVPAARTLASPGRGMQTPREEDRAPKRMPLGPDNNDYGKTDIKVGVRIVEALGTGPAQHSVGPLTNHVITVTSCITCRAVA